MTGTARAPLISVVVSSLNGSRKIGACLEALANQSIGEDAQIVVVDDGSSDDTASIAHKYTNDVVSHGTNRGLSVARNTGIECSRAPIVAFTDDDCIPSSEWLHHILTAHERPDVIGVGGPVDVAYVATLVHRYLVHNHPLVPLELDLQEHTSLLWRCALYMARAWRSKAVPSVGRHVFSFPGANMSFKKSALLEIGGFNPKQRFGSDDEYICGRIREHFSVNGLWFAPEAVVRHDFEGTFHDLARRNYLYGRAHAQVYLEDRTRRWPVIFPLPVLLLLLAWAWRKSPKLMLLPALVELAYPQGPIAVLRDRNAGCVAFSWLRLAEELSHDLGVGAKFLGVGDRARQQS